LTAKREEEKEKKEEEKDDAPTTLDSWFIKNKIAESS
jgi:hypothetical protein